MITVHVEPQDLINPLRLAAEAYETSAKDLKAFVEAAKDTSLMTVQGAQGLQDQMERQADDTRVLIDQLNFADGDVKFEIEMCEECGGNEKTHTPCVC